MKKLALALLSTGLLGMAWSGASSAQDSEAYPFTPVEAFICKYKDGQGRDDLDDNVERFNDWMGENDRSGYIAWILTPHSYTAEQDFDFIWLGAAPDYRAAGAGKQNWLENGGTIQQAFDEVASCNAHVNAASLQVRGGGGATPPNPVITIANCSVGEGRSTSDVVAGVTAWGAEQESRGWPGSTFMWFPVFGGGSAEFDFAMVGGFENHAVLGEYLHQWFATETWNETRMRFGGLMNCDVARVYDATLIHDSMGD
jgi:hypothetical protein